MENVLTRSQFGIQCNRGLVLNAFVRLNKNHIGSSFYRDFFKFFDQ